MVGLVILGCEGWRSAHDCVLQFQPQSFPAGDGHPPPHVSVGFFLSLTFFFLPQTPPSKLTMPAIGVLCIYKKVGDWLSLRMCTFESHFTTAYHQNK